MNNKIENENGGKEFLEINRGSLDYLTKVPNTDNLYTLNEQPAPKCSIILKPLIKRNMLEDL